MRTKDFTARVKAAGVADGLAEGQFVALVSVFGNEDSVGDIVRPGAFTETLAEWGSKGDPIPVIWSHAWGDPFAHVGTVVKAVETLQGLEVTGQIDDLETNPTAAQVYRLLKGRRVTQFSFAYDVSEGAWVNDDEHKWGGYYELRRLKLHEVGPCLVGANQETELIAAKAAGIARGLKAGRVLSQSNFNTLTSAYESIGEVLAAATPEKAKPAEEIEPEEPGQPGAAAADDEESSAKSADTPPAQVSLRIGDKELQAHVAELVNEELAKTAAALKSRRESSSTEDETTPDPRVATPEEGAAKVGTDSLRLRTRLELAELEASLTE
ncbi:HK97 family phage prohead protease [Streptomyces sp. NPDC056437]|uniref:HK97 family phage prohead protease n=1 Tax=Streptomyces sp. NPDC056437 TaxID=3345816 RepID=UPI0036CE9554